MKGGNINFNINKKKKKVYKIIVLPSYEIGGRVFVVKQEKDNCFFCIIGEFMLEMVSFKETLYILELVLCFLQNFQQKKSDHHKKSILEMIIQFILCLLLPIVGVHACTPFYPNFSFTSSPPP